MWRLQTKRCLSSMYDQKSKVKSGRLQLSGSTLGCALTLEGNRSWIMLIWLPDMLSIWECADLRCKSAPVSSTKLTLGQLLGFKFIPK